MQRGGAAGRVSPIKKHLSSRAAGINQTPSLLEAMNSGLLAFRDCGPMAARGHYANGKEVGHWEFWNSDGSPEEGVDYAPD